MKTNWRTPPELFNKLNAAVGGFRVDAAADAESSFCENWYGPNSPIEDGEDALKVPLWLSPAFCNPPYDDLAGWTRKFKEQHELGNTVVAIIPANVETDWFYTNVVQGGCSIMFMKGRVPFIDPANPTKKSQNRHPSVVLIYEHSGKAPNVNWWDWRPATKETK